SVITGSMGASGRDGRFRAERETHWCAKAERGRVIVELRETIRLKLFDRRKLGEDIFNRR
ncbi:MAG: hypothetical protein ACXW52_23180, partial [Candidatus Binatia bacterium]